MASTEDRLRKLVSENLEVDGKPLAAYLDINTSLLEAGVSSMELVAFAKVVQDEFGIKFEPEQCAEIQSLSALLGFLDTTAA